MRTASAIAEPAAPADLTHPGPGLATLLRVATWAALAAYLAFAVMLTMRIHHRLDPAGAPLGYDFSDFYQAARLAAEGHADAAYDDQAIGAAERTAIPGVATLLPWKYPPTFQLLLLPFAALPYVPAWLLWSTLSAALYALAIGRLAPGRLFWPLLLSPGAAISLLLGQNGLLSVALLGGGMALLPRRPVVAGLLLGAMSYKPHLAIMAPIALIAGREWRALAAAAASAAGLALLSLAAFGAAPWLAFFAKASALAGASDADWTRGPSLLAVLGSLGLPRTEAMAVHAIVAVAAAAALAMVWRRDSGRHWRAAVLATVAMIATPYLRIYDLALAAIPIAALATQSVSVFEIAALGFVWVAPAALIFAGLAPAAAPLMLAGLLGLILRRQAVGAAKIPGATP